MSAPNTPNTDFQPLSFDQAIQYYWTGPNDPTVTEYRLTLNYSGGSYVYTIPAPQVTYLATGLTNGVTYSATLEARNIFGYSTTPGTYRDWQPGAPPNPPATASAALVGSNAALVSWTAGTPVNAQVQWYVIDVYSTNNPLPVASYSANGLTQSNYFISGLNTALSYYFNVAAVNCPDYSLPRTTSTIQFLTPFIPTQVSGLQFWIDASNSTSLTLSGNGVVRWNDATSNGKYLSTASISGTPQYTTYTTLPAVRFDGVDDFLPGNFPLSGVLTATQKTMFVVGLAVAVDTNSGNPYENDSFIGDANGWVGLYLKSTGVVGAYNWPGSANTIEIPYTINSFGLFGYQQNNTVLGVNLNGNTPATTTTGGTGNMTNQVTFGRTYNANTFLNGYIMESLVYNTSLTPFDRQKVEGYLAWKWGLQNNLPTSHPFKTGAPYSDSVFTPTMFSSLQLWLDAQDTATFTFTSGTKITQMNDKSGNSRNAIPFENSPIYSATALNNYPAVQMAPVSTLRAPMASGVTNLGMSVFVVFQKTGATSAIADTLVTRGTLNIAGPIDMQTSAANNLRYRGNGSAQTADTATFSLRTATSPTLFNFYAAPSAWQEWVNGTISLNSATAASYADPAGVQYFFIGARADKFTEFRGNIGEVLLYNRNLSSDDRQTVEGYLAWKWGLQGNLPLTHPYKYVSPSSNYTTSMIVPQGLFINFTATTYSGSGNWLNAAALGPSYDASIYAGATTKNTAGNGIVFNGTNAWAFPNVYSSEISFSVWYKRTTTTIAAGESAILAQQLSGGNTITMCFGIGSVTSNVRFARFASSTWTQSSQTVGTTIGQWVHIVMSYTNSIVTTYSNAVSLGTTNVGGLGNGGQWFIGQNWNAGSPMNGEVGQILIYNRALTAAEVTQNYTATSNTFSV
jgi:hypothetical protein